MLRSKLTMDKAALLFHALSDSTRLELLERLKTGEQCVCELTDIMRTGQSRLSFHLKVLKDAGLLSDRREGRWMYYAIDRELLDDLEAYVSELKKTSKANAAARCC